MRKATHTVAMPQALKLGEGSLLTGAQLVCETHGELRGQNAIILLHGLSHSHRAAELPPPQGYSPHGWAHGLIGPDKVFDPDVDFIVAPNLLGSPFGSTSPISKDPHGTPWGARFPELSVADQARALQALLLGLGVRSAKAVVGYSLGGMVALAHAALFPESVRAVATVCGPAALSESVRRRMGLAKQLLAADPEFKENAPGERGVKNAVKRFRLKALRDLYPRDYLLKKYDDLFAAERALEVEAEAFAEIFDLDSCAALTRCMASCDVSEGLGAITAKVLVVASGSDELALPNRMQDTYHQLSAAGVNTRFFELQSDAGHRAPYLEQARLAAILDDFIR